MFNKLTERDAEGVRRVAFMLRAFADLTTLGAWRPHVPARRPRSPAFLLLPALTPFTRPTPCRVCIVERATHSVEHRLRLPPPLASPALEGGATASTAASPGGRQAAARLSALGALLLLGAMPSVQVTLQHGVFGSEFRNQSFVLYSLVNRHANDLSGTQLTLP